MHWTMAYRMTKFYTGLPDFETLRCSVDHLESPSKKDPKCKLETEDEIVMFLVKLRLNLLNEDLAFHFDVSVASLYQVIEVVGNF